MLLYSVPLVPPSAGASLLVVTVVSAESVVAFEVVALVWKSA